METDMHVHERFVHVFLLEFERLCYFAGLTFAEAHLST